MTLSIGRIGFSGSSWLPRPGNGAYSTRGKIDEPSKQTSSDSLGPFPIDGCEVGMCRTEDIMPLLKMTNVVEYKTSGRWFPPRVIERAHQYIKQRMALGKMDLTAVKKGGRIIASVCLEAADDMPMGKLSTLCVLPKYQQKGAGKWLTRLALRQAKKRELHWVELTSGNPVAIGMYQKMGFLPTHPDQTGEVTMEKDIEF